MCKCKITVDQKALRRMLRETKRLKNKAEMAICAYGEPCCVL